MNQLEPTRLEREKPIPRDSPRLLALAAALTATAARVTSAAALALLATSPLAWSQGAEEVPNRVRVVADAERIPFRSIVIDVETFVVDGVVIQVQRMSVRTSPRVRLAAGLDNGTVGVEAEETGPRVLLAAGLDNGTVG